MQPAPEPIGSPDSFSAGIRGRRLRRLASARLEGDEVLLGWTRAWVSIEGRYNVLFAARTRDFVVLTDRRLMLWSTGFFSRLPRRRVLADRLDDINVVRTPPLRGLRLTIRSALHKPLRVELAPGDRSVEFANQFVARVPAPPEQGEPPEPPAEDAP